MPALPTNPPWDILYLTGTSFGSIFSYSGVTTGGNSGQFTENSTNLVMQSGSDAGHSTDLQLYISVNVPNPFTFEGIFSFDDLPVNFTDLSSEHIYIGASSAAGSTFGLFISQVGVAYAGSIHHDGDGNMVIDSAVQTLPNSQNYITQGEQITIRVATDLLTGATYIYITPTAIVATLGQQLRYVLPALSSENMAENPPDQVQLSVLGFPGRQSQVTISELFVGTGLNIPVVMPNADAGSDQSVLTCQIIKLDGSKSSDPQGGTLTYLWQLVDAPLGSQFIFNGNDGQTYPLVPPSGFTHKFYSASLGEVDSETAIVTGVDLIVVDGSPYVIESTGSDGDGFYVDIGVDDLPDNLPANTPFNFLPQNGISNPTSAIATFFPDIPGIYKFNLTVSNGALASFPAECIANVTASFIPRGVIPDMGFIWGYLSDFWKLLEDPDRIEVFWSAFSQCLAAELLTLWQIDYSKSLRDIQRTFQRRWLHYDMALYEATPLVEQTTVRAVFGGVTSSLIPTSGTSGVVGNHLDLFLAMQPLPVVITFAGTNSQTAQQIADRINAFMGPIDSSFVARVVPKRDGTGQYVRLDAPYQFSVAPTSTLTLFTSGAVNGIAQGTSGAVVGSNAYRVERSLTQVPIQAGDYLTVGSDTYMIVSVVDNAADPLFNQRIVTKEPIPATEGTTWLISGQITSTDLDFYNGLIEAGDLATLEVINTATGQIALTTVPVTGVCVDSTGVLGADVSSVGQFLANPSQYEVYFQKVVRRQYTPIDPLVLDVPYLQELINNTDDTQVLRRNLDYFVDTFRGNPCIRFIVGSPYDVWENQVPPDRMWAETTYVDNRPRIEANFGIPADFTLDDLSQLPSNVDYLSAVTGLWYAYFNGPVVFNLRAGAQILLGLPFAEEAGTIIEIRDDFSTTTGRILVQDTANSEIIRSYTFPPSLGLETNPATKAPYAVGDTVAQFAPLVQGVDIYDWVNSPKWFSGLVAQGSMYEVQKYFTFMVRVSSVAFNLNALLYVQSFIQRIKPTYTFPLFVVQAVVPPIDITVTDSVSLSGTLKLFESPGFAPPNNIAGMWDQPNETFGGWWGQYDSNGTTPSYDTPTIPVQWGFDRLLNTPNYFIEATYSQTVSAGIPTFDGIFKWDIPLFTSKVASFGNHSIHSIPTTEPGISLGTYTIPSSSSADYIYLELAGYNGGHNPYILEVWQNGSLVLTQNFNIGGAGRDYEAYACSLTFAASDVLEVRIRASVDAFPWIHDILVVLGNGMPWAYDTSIAAGTYQQFRSL